jgi:hypothetical protein
MNNGFTNLTEFKTYILMRFLFFGTIVIILSSCQTSKTNENVSYTATSTENVNYQDTGKNRDIYTRAAIETCECFSEMLQKANQLELARKEKQAHLSEILSQEIEIMRPQVQACSEDILKKYNNIQSGSAKGKVFQILQEQCPQVAHSFGTPITEKRIKRR